MLVLILIAIWIAVLAPTIIRRFRDQDTDRSIVNFHERMARLGGRTSPTIAPAHRLDVSDETPPRPVYEYESNPPTRAPQLRVVPANATVGDLERDLSWEEWSLAHSDTPVATQPQPRQMPVHADYRASAYSRVPSAVTTRVAERPTSQFGTRSQRVRRRQVLMSLVGVTLVTSLLAVVTGVTLIAISALLSWTALAGFLGLMYYAMTTGMIETSQSRPTRLVNPRLEPAVASTQIAYNEFDLAYEPEATTAFERTNEVRYAQAL